MRIKNAALYTSTTLVAGGLLGAGLALLLAPQSGQETRRDLRRLGKAAKRKSAQIGAGAAKLIRRLPF